jgi:hypothetical protein
MAAANCHLSELKNSLEKKGIYLCTPNFSWGGSPSTAQHRSAMKGYGVATLAQNKILFAKQELLLSEITGLPLDTQMQRNRLDVDERVEGSRQCSCSRPPCPSRVVHPCAPDVAPPRYPHVQGRNADRRCTSTSRTITNWRI